MRKQSARTGFFATATAIMLALGSVGAAALLVPASAQSRRVVPLLEVSNVGRYKPSSFRIANHTGFTHAHWVRWGSSAVASVTAVTQYPQASTRRYRTRLTLSRVRNMCGGQRYTRASWRYPGDSANTVSSFQPFSPGKGLCGYWNGA